MGDAGNEVTADSLKKVVNASGVKVAPYWPMLFAQALQGQDIGSFLAVSQDQPQSKPLPLVAMPVLQRKKPRKKKLSKKKKRIWILVTCSDKLLRDKKYIN